MAGDRGVRASDADRERIAAALGGHYAAGRLTLEEFQERLDQAYAAKTLGQLDDLLADLPRTDLGQLPGTDLGQLPGTDLGQSPGAGRQPGGRHAPGTVPAPAGRRAALPAFWLAITATTAVIWLISAAIGATWLLWIAVPMAFIVLRRLIVGGGGHRRSPR